MTDFLKQIHGQMFSFDFAWDILSKPRSKIVKPVTVFRGNLTLGDSSAHPDSTFSVPVHVFNKTSEFKVPSAKKWNARSTAEENAISDHTVAIQREYVYKDVDEDEESESADAQAEDIEKEDLTKSFFFGRRLMPCYADDEEAWKLRTEKEFVMLGFVDMQKV